MVLNATENYWRAYIGEKHNHILLQKDHFIYSVEDRRREKLEAETQFEDDCGRAEKK